VVLLLPAFSQLAPTSVRHWIAASVRSGSVRSMGRRLAASPKLIRATSAPGLTQYEKVYVTDDVFTPSVSVTVISDVNFRSLHGAVMMPVTAPVIGLTVFPGGR